MTTKQAARLAAIGTTLALASTLISNFLAWFPLATDSDGSRFSWLLAAGNSWFFAFVLLAALPVFFILLYRSQPLLLIPSRLKKAAWVAAIASGLLAIQRVLLWGARLLVRSDPSSDTAKRMSHPIVWALRKADGLVVSPSITLFAALTLLLFFMAAARSKTGTQTTTQGLRRAAMYACVAAALMAAMSLLSAHSFTATSYHKLLGTSAWLWTMILPAVIGGCYQASLAAFFFTFFLKLRAPQSNRRLSFRK